MQKIKLIIILAVLCGLATFSHAQKAANFSLQTTTQVVSLDSLKGKVVYLDFWASWCDPCRKSFPWMNDLYNKYSSQGFTIIAVNLDKKRGLAYDFLDKHPASFIVAFDPTGETPKVYDVKGMPTCFLIDREGNIQYTHVGFKTSEAQDIENKVKELLAK